MMSISSCYCAMSCPRGIILRLCSILACYCAVPCPRIITADTGSCYCAVCCPRGINTDTAFWLITVLYLV